MAHYAGPQLVRTGRMVHDDWKRWLLKRGFTDHAFSECLGCGKDQQLHAPDMCEWSVLPIEHQEQYERVGSGDLEAAAVITARCLTLTSPGQFRELGIVTFTGEALLHVLMNGRRCYQVLDSPIPLGASVRDVEYDSIHNMLRVTIEGPGLPQVYRGGIAPIIQQPLVTQPLCQNCECCH